MNCKELLAFLSNSFDADFMEYGAKKSAPSGAGSEIIDVELLRQDIIIKSRTAYIIDPETAFTGSLPDCAIVCGEPPAWLNFSKVHRLFVLRNADSDAVLSRCEDEITLGNAVSAVSSGIYGMMHKVVRLANLVNAAAEGLNNPIIIYDSNYKILYYSDNYEMNDPAWDAGVMERMTVATDHVHEMESYRGTRPTTKDGFRFLCPHSPYERLVSFILHENTVCGNVLMLAINEPIGDFHIRMIPVISQIVLACMLRDGQLGTDNRAKSSVFLLELLRGRRAAELMMSNAKPLGITLPKYYVCACVYFSPVQQYTNAQHLEIRSGMLSALDDALVASYDGNLVFMAKAHDKLFCNYADTEPELSRIAKKYKLRIALSNVFSTPLDFKLSYEQTKDCILFAEHMKISGRVYRYSQTNYYSILNMANDAQTLSLSIHPAIKLLEVYDLENGTQFLQTLRVYVLCNQSIKKSIEALHMHRNTFNYQLKRILELTGIDVEDFENIFYLSCSFRTYEYLKLT